MKMKSVMLGLTAIFIFLSLNSARAETFGGVNIYRVAPDSTFIGQKIWIALVFENIADTGKTIALNESLAGGASFNQSGAQYIQTAYGEKIWYYEWRITLEPKANTSVAYWLVPNVAGTYVISPTTVIINGQGFRLKSHAIEVRCNTNQVCEAGENYLNCPEDCSTGSADGICDGAADGRCDPDCEAANDADCQAGAEQKNQTVPEEKKPADYLTGTLMLIIPVVILAALAAFYLMKRKGKK